MFVAVLFSAQTQKGNSFIGLKASDVNFSNYNKVTTIGVGLQGGHFIQNNLALVAQAGYNSIHANDFNMNDWSYGTGFKYYVDTVLPLQIDWNGATDNLNNTYKSNLGFSVGYAWRPINRITVEPTLRYDVSLKEDKLNKFSGGVGVNYFFK